MRAFQSAVVVSSLLFAAAVSAQPKAPAGGTTGTKGGTTGSAAPTSTTPTPASGSGAGSGAAPAPTGTPAPAPSPDLASVKPEEMPTAVRMRRLEQKTQALKERAWQLK